VLYRFVVCAVFVSRVAMAQPASGELDGRLRDQNDKPVTGLLGVSIHVTDGATGAKFAGAISSHGTFHLGQLPAGTYQLDIPLPCCLYQSFSQKGVVIAPGATLHLEPKIGWGVNLGTIGDDPGVLGFDMRSKAGSISGPTPRTSKGKPDFSGVWHHIVDPEAPRFAPPPMQPWALEIQKQLLAMGVEPNAATFCLPQAASLTTLPFPFKLVQNDSVIVHIVEFATPGFRQIFLDGREHPKEWNPSWHGHSIGKWEGDTLVVDTVGFNEVTPFGVHSEQLHVAERIRRPDLSHLEIDLTAEDPAAWTGVYKAHFRSTLIPQEEILEFVCPENNKDPLHFGGLGWKGRP
jgi:hypothetical protein